MKEELEKLPETVEIINQDAIIAINMSTSYYNRLQQVFNTMLSDKSPEEVQEAHEQIKTKNIKELWIANLETLMIVINEFQRNAKEQKKTKIITKEEFKKLIEKDSNE